MTRRRQPGIRAAIALTVALLAAATLRWQVAAIGYAALALTWVISRASLRRIRRALAPRRYRWRDVASPEDIHPRSFPQDVKVQAAVRDGGMCQCTGCGQCHPSWYLVNGEWLLICGAVEEIQFDHVRPWSMGGPSVLTNCRTKCGPCNRAKGASILP